MPVPGPVLGAVARRASASSEAASLFSACYDHVTLGD